MSYPLSPDEYGEIVKRSLADAIERSETDYAAEEFQWWSFSQVFSSTALMGGRPAGQALTSGQVVAVLCDDGMFVYCNGAFAYKMSRAEGMECVTMHNFPTRPPANSGERVISG